MSRRCCCKCTTKVCTNNVFNTVNLRIDDTSLSLPAGNGRSFFVNSLTKVDRTFENVKAWASGSGRTWDGETEENICAWQWWFNSFSGPTIFTNPPAPPSIDGRYMELANPAQKAGEFACNIGYDPCVGDRYEAVYIRPGVQIRFEIAIMTDKRIRLRTEIRTLYLSANWIYFKDFTPPCNLPVIGFGPCTETNLDVSYTDLPSWIGRTSCSGYPGSKITPKLDNNGIVLNPETLANWLFYNEAAGASLPHYSNYWHPNWTPWVWQKARYEKYLDNEFDCETFYDELELDLVSVSIPETKTIRKTPTTCNSASSFSAIGDDLLTGMTLFVQFENA